MDYCAVCQRSSRFRRPSTQLELLQRYRPNTRVCKSDTSTRTLETFQTKYSHTETKSRQAFLVASSFLFPSCHRPLFSRFRYLDHARSPKQSHDPPGIPTFLANDQSGNIRRNAIIVNCLRVLCARAIASLPRRTASDPSHSHTSIHAFLQTSQRFASVSSRNLKRREETSAGLCPGCSSGSVRGAGPLRRRKNINSPGICSVCTRTTVLRYQCTSCSKFIRAGILVITASRSSRARTSSFFPPAPLPPHKTPY